MAQQLRVFVSHSN
jgi:hypothetical protein